MAITANINSKDEGVGAQAPILQVRNLSKAFGAMMAVNNLSFEVPAGEVAVVLGAMGAGAAAPATGAEPTSPAGPVSASSDPQAVSRRTDRARQADRCMLSAYRVDDASS